MANIIMAQGFAKFFINMAFSSIYVYTCELFPTVLRYCQISTGTNYFYGRFLGNLSAATWGPNAIEKFCRIIFLSVA